MAVLLILLMLVQPSLYQECSTSTKADIVFMVDGSGSVGDAGFQSFKAFMSRFVELFNIGPSHTQIGVMIYPYQITFPIYLRSYSDVTQLKNAINSIVYGEVWRYGGIMSDMLNATNGKRNDATPIVIIITDDVWSVSVDEATALKNSGVVIYVAAVGNFVAGSMDQVVSRPEYFMSVTDFSSLQTLEGNLSVLTCEAIQGCLPTTCKNGGSCHEGTTTYRCTCPAAYSGWYCDQSICSINSPGCGNRGECSIEGATWKCTCNPGHSNCSIDCGSISISNGKATLTNGNTFHGSSAAVNCDIGYRANTPTVTCQSNGYWSSASCTIVDCGLLNQIVNGSYKLPGNISTFGSIADVICDKGFERSHEQVACQEDGIWENANCTIKDCGTLPKPELGSIEILSGTKYLANVTYTCNQGYELIGDQSRNCQSTGTWSGKTPLCLQTGVPRIVCPTNTDYRGGEWKEVLSGTNRTQLCDDNELFKGYASRFCSADGSWQHPQYNCVRDSVDDVRNQIDSLSKNVSLPAATDVLSSISNETSRELLTTAELSSLTDYVDKVADLLLKSNGSTNLDIAKKFIEITSKVIDVKNEDAWKSSEQSNSSTGEKLMLFVDKIGDVLRKSIQDVDINNASIVEDNLAVGVHKVTTEILVFPNQEILHDSRDKHEWILESKSGILLNTSTLGDDVVVTTVIFKEITYILPSRSNSSSNSKSTVNGPIISVSISNNPTKLDPPIILTFGHGQTNMTNPVCSFLRFARSTDQPDYWASDGCKVRDDSNESITVCECDHLTHFAVLMNPFVEAEANSHALRLLSIVAMSVSAFCLLLKIIVFFKLWRYVRSDKSVITLHLSAALIVSYVIFIAGVDRTENKIVCTAVAAALHYIYLVGFCLMLAEGIRIAADVILVFARKSRLLHILLSAWSIPAIIVATTLAITKTNGYGNENYCWLTLLPGLRWAFVGPALFIILCNIIVLILLFKKMFTLKAMNNKTIKEKVKTTIWSLCVLVPLLGISWIFGILYVSNELSFMQYLFAICNGLQGVLIFIFNCVLNGQVRAGLKKERIKYLNKAMTTCSPQSLQSFPKEATQNQKVGDPVKTETELSPHHLPEFHDELKKTIELFSNRCGNDLNELPTVNGNPNGKASDDGTG